MHCMTRQNFEKALRAFHRQRPFQPFALELINGSRIEIKHPEVLRQHEEDDLLVYRSTAGIHSIFECQSVVRFIEGTENG